MEARNAAEDLPLVVDVPVGPIGVIVILVHAREGEPVVVDAGGVVAGDRSAPRRPSGNAATWGPSCDFRDDVAGERRSGDRAAVGLRRPRIVDRLHPALRRRSRTSSCEKSPSRSSAVGSVRIRFTGSRRFCPSYEKKLKTLFLMIGLPTGDAPHVVADQRGRGRGGIGPGVQLGIAAEIVGRSVPVVRPRLHLHGDDAAGGVADTRRRWRSAARSARRPSPSSEHSSSWAPRYWACRRPGCRSSAACRRRRRAATRPSGGTGFARPMWR